MNLQRSEAGKAGTSRHWKRASKGFTLVAVGATGLAVALRPVRAKLAASLPVLALKSRRERSVSNAALTAEVARRIDSVTAELHLPAVQVSVADQVATLHGEVGSAIEAGAVEDAASAVRGVHGVVSHLTEKRVDLVDRRDQDDGSTELRDLLASARTAGCSQSADSVAVRTVLAVFLEHLPPAQRATILLHLPPDVRRIAGSPRRSGIAVGMLPNTIDALVEAVSHVVALPRETAHEVVVSVLQTLRDVLPEEFRDIQAQLPHELADLWTVSPVPIESKPGCD